MDDVMLLESNGVLYYDGKQQVQMICIQTVQQKYY